MDDVAKTLVQRGEQYGKAWKQAGEMISQVDMTQLQKTPYAHNWVQILGKLIRALASPNDPEHWRDMAGYATLVLEDLQASTSFYPNAQVDRDRKAMYDVVPKGDHYDIVPGK